MTCALQNLLCQNLPKLCTLPYSNEINWYALFTFIFRWMIAQESPNNQKTDTWTLITVFNVVFIYLNTPYCGECSNHSLVQSSLLWMRYSFTLTLITVVNVVINQLFTWIIIIVVNAVIIHLNSHHCNEYSNRFPF